MALTMRWIRERNPQLAGWWRGMCPGEGCGRRLAKYWSNETRHTEFFQEELTLERGYVPGADGIHCKSGKWKDNYPIRSRKLAQLRRTGYGFPSSLEPKDHPARGPKVEPGALVRCLKCLNLVVEVTKPKVF